jgi:tetratricopeptide (TPR) repeat protein
MREAGVRRIPGPLRTDATIVAGTAAVLRILFWVETRDDPLFSILAIDGRSYVELATRWASGDWLWGTEPLWFGTLYPFCVGVLFRIFGPDPDVVRILQHGLGVGTALLGWRVGARFSRTAGLVAGLALALSPVLVFYEHQLYDPSVAAFLTALFLEQLLARGRPALPGIALGLLGLARSNALVFVPFGARWIGRRLGSRAAILFAAASLAPLVPVLLRNGIVSGAWTPLTVNGGMIFATGFGDDALGGRALLRRPEDFGPGGAFHREAERIAGRPLGLAEASELWRDRTVAWIVEHPGATARLTLRKLALLAHVRETDDNLGFPLVRDRAATLAWWPGPWAWLLVGGAIGAARLAGRPGRTGEDARAVTLFVLVYSASLLLFFVNARYRLPLVAPLAVLAGAAAGEVWSSLRGRSARHGWLAPLAAGAVCAFLALRDPGVRADPALQFVAIGGALQDEGRPVEALAFAERALSIDPGLAGAHHNRALALRALGRRDEALAAAEEAVRRDPALSPAWMTLGALLAERGRVADALPAFRRAAELSPDDPGALTNLAHALARTGDFPGAVEAGRRAQQRGAALGPELAAWEASLGARP